MGPAARPRCATPPKHTPRTSQYFFVTWTDTTLMEKVENATLEYEKSERECDASAGGRADVGGNPARCFSSALHTSALQLERATCPAPARSPTSSAATTSLFLHSTSGTRLLFLRCAGARAERGEHVIPPWPRVRASHSTGAPPFHQYCRIVRWATHSTSPRKQAQCCGRSGCTVRARHLETRSAAASALRGRRQLDACVLPPTTTLQAAFTSP